MSPEGSPLDLNNFPGDYISSDNDKQIIEDNPSSSTGHRLKSSSGVIIKEVIDENGKVYECRFCSLKFYKSQALGGHMNRHRQERETETLNRARQLVFTSDNLTVHHHHIGAAFERMKDDVAYGAYFDNEELVGEFDETVDGLIAPPKNRKKVGPPMDADWDRAEVFVDFLEAFYEVTLRVSSTLRPAANTCFHDIMVIENKLRDLYVPITDHATLKRTELEELLSSMSTRMTSKYEKYFGRHSDMNQLLFVALFLDPRFKLTSVAHLFVKEGISDADLKARTTKIIDLVKKLYDEYKPPIVVVPSQSFSSQTQSTLSSTGSTETKGPKRKSLMSLLQNLPVNDDNLVFKHEVDIYLSDKLEYFNVDIELDILNWWKLHGPKYPVLALMAKDVLAIQVSSVASESAFSTGGRIVDTSRSSLTPKSVEALLCLQDWIKGDHITTYIKDEPSIESYTFYEQCEEEISSVESCTNTLF